MGTQWPAVMVRGDANTGLGYTAQPADTTAAPPLWTVSPYTVYHTQHIYTQPSTNNCTNILYSYTDLRTFALNFTFCICKLFQRST